MGMLDSNIVAWIADKSALSIRVWMADKLASGLPSFER